MTDKDLIIVMSDTCEEFLKQREQEVVKSFFGFDGRSRKTLQELAEKFEVSKQRIGQIKDKATKNKESVILGS